MCSQTWNRNIFRGEITEGEKNNTNKNTEKYPLFMRVDMCVRITYISNIFFTFLNFRFAFEHFNKKYGRSEKRSPTFISNIIIIISLLTTVPRILLLFTELSKSVRKNTPCGSEHLTNDNWMKKRKLLPPSAAALYSGYPFLRPACLYHWLKKTKIVAT